MITINYSEQYESLQNMFRALVEENRAYTGNDHYPFIGVILKCKCGVFYETKQDIFIGMLDDDECVDCK